MDWISAGKNKKTGEIVTVITISSGTNGTEISYIGGDGIPHYKTLAKFEKEFDRIDYDFSSLVPYLLEGAKFLEDIRKLLYPLARKCTPDYYSVGALVGVNNIDNNISAILGDFGNDIESRIRYGGLSEIMFKIIAIEKEPTEPGLFWIHLKSYSWGGYRNCKDDKLREGYDRRVPFYKDRIFSKDAAYYLKRYDREF